jgi:tetratricopeptide (TPR) repeat protein
LAVRDGMGRDRDGAKRLAASIRDAAASPALATLQAELSLGDRSVPSKVSRGRASRELEAAMEKDKGDVLARLLSAGIALEDGRHAEATELVNQARAAHKPIGYPVAMTQSRVDLALGIDAQAEHTAAEALTLQPGLCEALNLRYDIARKRDAAADADRLLKDQAKCPGHLGRVAEHARMRGDLEAAAAAYRKLLERDPGHIPTASQLTNLYVSLRRFDDAVRLLEDLRKSWPRNAALAKRLGEVHDFAGQPEKALAAREQALLLDGGDLTLRRTVERTKTGKELLQDHAIDGKAALDNYQAQPGSEDAASIYILDAAAVRAYPDGSTVDRIHIIQKALDQSGVSSIGEVTIPAGAQVLSLRTIKADGTVLEPENIEGKDAISLPGVQVGDYVEYEYLQANRARGPSQPGFTLASFYFQIARQPNHWSTYKVIAPKGAGLGVEAHNMPPLKVQKTADAEVFFHEERHVPPYIPEPNGPPSGNEYLPFVTVGAGATGSDGLVATYADNYLDRGRITSEVELFARAAAEGKSGLEAAQAIYAAVNQKLQGRDAGLSMSAAHSVAQDRGSRLWLLKASLEAVGIPTRVAAVRTFATDPASYLFPNETLLPYLCLRAEVPDYGEVWLDPVVRFAPFGELPEQAAGGRDAYLFPEPGRPLVKVKTPPFADRVGKVVTLDLKLEADGRLTGTGQEVYAGFEAAQLAEALEALSPDQRNQALQSALSRYFGGADLSKLELEMKREVGAPLTVRYQFSAPQFARVEGDRRLVLGALTFPVQLGRRYVQLGSRRTPLYIDNTERSRTEVKLALPPGWTVSTAGGELKTQSAVGTFVRTERQEGSTFLVSEDYRLQMARVPTNQYNAFAQFAGEVDLIQSRDLAVEKK